MFVFVLYLHDARNMALQVVENRVCYCIFKAKSLNIALTHRLLLLYLRERILHLYSFVVMGCRVLCRCNTMDGGAERECRGRGAWVDGRQAARRGHSRRPLASPTLSTPTPPPNTHTVLECSSVTLDCST